MRRLIAFFTSHCSPLSERLEQATAVLSEPEFGPLLPPNQKILDPPLTDPLSSYLAPLSFSIGHLKVLPAKPGSVFFQGRAFNNY